VTQRGLGVLISIDSSNVHWAVLQKRIEGKHWPEPECVACLTEEGSAAKMLESTNHIWRDCPSESAWLGLNRGISTKSNGGELEFHTRSREVNHTEL